FYSQYNKVDTIKKVVVAYYRDEPSGCGAVKEFTAGTMEVKRMFVPLEKRGLGIASKVLQELERGCLELGYTRCILETGKKQPEAIALYTKNGYRIIPNYGQYAGIENSICFEKKLVL
ncbi:MAG: GNAT family N-acetyltransferase, partial [Ferruginibacter sp.]